MNDYLCADCGHEFNYKPNCGLVRCVKCYGQRSMLISMAVELFGENWREECFPKEITIFDKMLFPHFENATWTMKEILQAIDHSGYQIVPKEPTDEMLEGSRFAMSTWHDIAGSQLTVNREKARIRYKAMLAKAPKIGKE